MYKFHRSSFKFLGFHTTTIRHWKLRLNMSTIQSTYRTYCTSHFSRLFRNKMLFCKKLMMHSVSVADPGSEFFPSRIPDPNFSIPDPGSASKNLWMLTQKKIFPSSMKYDPGCASRIRILTFLPIPDPVSRGQKRTGSRIRIRNTAYRTCKSKMTMACMQELNDTGMERYQTFRAKLSTQGSFT